MSSHRIVVTGGAGFIGSNLIKKLIHRNNEVLAIDNLFVGKEKSIPEGCLFEKVDIRSNEIKKILNMFEPDVIIHLAALHYIPYCNNNPEETFNVNVMGTKNLLDSYNPESFVFASSAAVYPISNFPLKEEAFGPIDIYGKTKLIGEDLVKLYCNNHIIGRFFNVYGNNDIIPHLIPDLIKQIKKGRREVTLGNLISKRDYIHVDDVTNAVFGLLNNLRYGTYNIGTGIEYSAIEIVEIISELIGDKISIVQDNERLRRVDRENLIADITKIKSFINWQPKIKLKEGLYDLIFNY